MLLAIVLFGQAQVASQSLVQVTVLPKPVYIEVGADQYVNCDFLVENRLPDTARLVSVELKVRSTGGRVSDVRVLDYSGTSPGILTIPTREFPPGSSTLIFNPFHTFSRDLAIRELDFTWGFEVSDSSSRANASATVAVTPELYHPRTHLRLPLAGHVLVATGHDFYDNHRRYNYADSLLQRLGIRRNSQRYAYDLTLVSDAGEAHPPRDSANAAWFGFGAPVRAPASGRVVALHDGQPDNTVSDNYFNAHFDPDSIAARPLSVFGNYVIIDHGHGEFSLLGHLQDSSLVVGLHDLVRQGQVVAKLGFAGSTFTPHLHYELRSSGGTDAEGLPAYFADCRLDAGAGRSKLANGHLESGMVVDCH